MSEKELEEIRNLIEGFRDDEDPRYLYERLEDIEKYIEKGK